MAYAGEMEFARAQFASDAPQLQLVAMADVLAPAARPDGRGAIDVAFVDSGSPSVNAAALVMELRRVLPSLPIVLALDPGRDDAAKIAWQLGVDDYTVKSPGWLARLTVRLSLALARHERAVRGDQLKAQEDRLRSIVETAPACLARVARDGTVLAVNAAARALIGATTNREVLKKPFGTFVGADDRERTGRFIEQVSDGTAATLELSIARLSGESRRVEASAVPLPAKGNIPATALLLLGARTEPARVEVETPAAAVAAPVQPDRQAELELRVAELEEAQRRLEAERDALTASTATAQAEGRAAHAEARTLADRLEAADQTRKTVDAERAALVQELEALRAAEAQHRRLAADHQELQRSLEESRQRHTDAARLATTDYAESQLRVAALDAECARLMLERNRLASESEIARTAQRALEEEVARLQSHAAASATTATERDELRRTHAALTAERDELRRANETLTAERDEQRRASETLIAERDELRRASETIAAERDELRRASETIAAERDELRRASETLATERDELRRFTATHASEHDELRQATAALAAERDELRRSIEIATARHATEVALAFADKASLERRLQDAEAHLQHQLDEHRAAHGRALDEEAETRRQLEAEVELLTCERDAVLRALAQSQEYEAHARRWMTQWLELEQAMQRTRREIQRLVEWPQDGLATPAAPPAPPASHGTAAESPWH